MSETVRDEVAREPETSGRVPHCREAVLRWLDAAVAEGREACAALADEEERNCCPEGGEGASGAAGRTARAIRARGNP